MKCEAAEGYRRQMLRDFEQQAATLATLTGWNIAQIRQRMSETGQVWQ